MNTDLKQLNSQELMYVFLIAIIMFIIIIFITQYIWNLVIPDYFGLKEITFFQTFCIIILSNILFGSHCRTIY